MVEEDHKPFSASERGAQDGSAWNGLSQDMKAPVEIKPVSFRQDDQNRSTSTSSRAKILIGVSISLVLLLLCATAWFVFTARKVVIHIEPEPERVSIHGGLAAPRIGGYYLLRPGEYTMQAVKKCFHSMDKTFVVTHEKTQQMWFSMTKLPGRLSFHAHRADRPSHRLEGVLVSVDGKEVGRTALNDLEVTPGKRKISIHAEKYQDFHTEVDVEGCGSVQELDFALVPAWSEVTIDSTPQGATVQIDGNPVGNTPLEFQLLEGEHELEILAYRFKPWRTNLTIKANEPRNLGTISLHPADGTLKVRTRPSGAHLSLGERYVGTTPSELKLSPNKTYEVRLSKAGYETSSRKVSVASEESKTLSVKLKPKTGSIHLVVQPGDAEIRIDGKSMGRVPSQIELVAVEHQLEITKQGYLPYRTSVTPTPGFPQEVVITLARQGGQKNKPSTIIHAKNGHSLRLVRPRAFTMGSSRREQGRRSNETLRRVTLKRPFYMGVREVTNRQFREFQASHNSGVFKGKSLNLDHQPVVQVTWEQAALFCNWLSARESLPPVYIRKGTLLVANEPLGTGYRLPTEAEWEYCARFNKEKKPMKYPWGNGFPPASGSGNFADVSARNILPSIIRNYRDGYPVAAPFEKFKPNALALFDMGGNASEWCHDYYSIYTYDAEKVYVDPTGADKGKHHVVRGGSWKEASISALRVAYRDYSNKKRPELGFRICRYAE